MSEKRGFTPAPIVKKQLSFNEQLVRGFTLVELLIVITIIGILAALALPQFDKTKEHALGQEAQSSLRLIAASEKIYRMENDSVSYYPGAGSVGLSAINSNLKLYLTGTNWDYSISSGSASTFTATAKRQSGAYSSCNYSINESSNVTDNLPYTGACP